MKLKCTLYSQPCSYSESGFRFSVIDGDIDMSKYGHTTLETREIDFDVPPREVLVNGAIDAYRKEQQRLRAEAEMKANNIEEAIQKLLAITDQRAPA